ncbi:MAG: hypothetical protein Q7S27_04685 [Nanoarchaeota archaeon]|nr:hypothetical protein [Nanoarchaeota archaeon]
MIIKKENLIEYLLNSDSSLEDNFSDKTLENLSEWHGKYGDPSLSIVDNLFLYHQDSNKSINLLANEAKTSHPTLTKIFRQYNLPNKTNAEATRENWKDEEFRKRNAEGLREMLNDRWKDEEFRRKHSERTKELWENEEFRKRNAEAVKKNWKDEEFRKRHSEGLREMLNDRWKDEEFRRKHSERTKELWENEEFRKRQAEATRDARLNPNNLSRYRLPTFQGYRGDIQLETQSMWEANIARIFHYLGREYLPHQRFDLDVPEKYRAIFNSDKTSLQIDFIVKNKRGRIHAYEIRTNKEDKNKAEKLELFVEQYQLPLKLVTPEKYYRLASYFGDKINSSENLAGWETSEDNLRTNPTKYSNLSK